MDHFYKEHHIQVSVREDSTGGWLVNLFIFYREGVQRRLATFMLNETWVAYSQAIEAGLKTAKHWIDAGKP
jgi:hypothetical protein